MIMFNQNIINLEKQYIADKLRINLSQLEEYFNLPISSYKDYKNDGLLYKFGSNVFKLLGKEIGGKL